MELLLLFLVVALVLPIWMASRARRRAREAAEQLEYDTDQAREGGDGNGRPPSLFDLFMGPGTWARSYEFDPETGQWVDVSDRSPEPVPARDGKQDEERKKQKVSRARPRAAANPLGGLFGGMGQTGGTGGGGDFEVQPSDELIDFGEVGGMESLKRELHGSVGLLLKHPDEAERYGIDWNGILLHGPPGVGKTFFAQAIAGEYDLNLIHVSTGDLVSSLVGGSAQNIQKAFETALDNLPCLLFFDEFDSVAQRRDGTPDQEARRTVNQLLTSLEAHREERRLLVMAATNSIEHLDPAVIRAGRFDRHIRIDLPDAEARRSIFAVELADRPAARDIDLDELVRRTEGMTPAAISKIVDTAALAAFREATETGQSVELASENLIRALEQYGGQDRPTVEHWTWESLILPRKVKAQLQQLQALIEDPERAHKFGVEPPTGLLLAGPPGTGKTTVAKVLAAQARTSFYPLSGADVISKWVGESERNIRQVFERARENRPSIVFIDEIDAVAGARGEFQVHDSHVNQLLAEIDGVAGQRGVFVIGATNRPDQLDPALLRGGRLSRTIYLGLPDEAARLAILRLHTARMPTVGVRFEDLAREAEGFSPADLKSLSQEAALVAMEREDASGPEAAVLPADFAEALSRLRESRAASRAAA
jgi:transitional endoplasmic reticulum ATPase